MSPDSGAGTAVGLHLVLAECHLGQRRAGEALSHLDQARSLDPQAVRTLLRLAEGYSRAGQFEDAGVVYWRVLEIAPDDQEARDALSELGWSGTTGGQ
jgi:tetratricopeptide (TPR) repeat protein